MFEQLSPNVTFNSDFDPKYFSLIQNGIKNVDVEIFNENIQIIDIEFDDNTDTTILLKRLLEEKKQKYIDRGHFYPVNKTGLVGSDEVGSNRFCMSSSVFSVFLTNVLERGGTIPKSFIKVANYFRFMEYSEGGEHYPHYDSDFVIDNEYLTKWSLVMYFSDSDSGELCFVNDTRPDKHLKQDYSEQASEDQIYLKVKPKFGRIVLFNHNLCHGVLPFTDEYQKRFMVRGDLIFLENYAT